MTTIASHQTTVEASEIAQAHKDQPGSNEVQTSQMSLDDQAREIFFQVQDRIIEAQAKAAVQKKSQTVAVRDEALRQLEAMWDMAFKAGQNHGLQLAFQSIATEAPVNPFKSAALL
jgi:hypothetical protein